MIYVFFFFFLPQKEKEAKRKGSRLHFQSYILNIFAK